MFIITSREKLLDSDWLRDCDFIRNLRVNLACEQTSFGRREEEGRGWGVGGEKERREGNERKKEEACMTANCQHVHSMQSENTDQSASLFTQQLARKILPQFVQAGVMCK